MISKVTWIIIGEISIARHLARIVKRGWRWRVSFIIADERHFQSTECFVENLFGFHPQHASAPDAEFIVFVSLDHLRDVDHDKWIEPRWEESNEIVIDEKIDHRHRHERQQHNESMVASR